VGSSAFAVFLVTAAYPVYGVSAAYEATNRKLFYELNVQPPVSESSCPAGSGSGARDRPTAGEVVPRRSDRRGHRPDTELTLRLVRLVASRELR
jgi:hypothetical protein